MDGRRVRFVRLRLVSWGSHFYNTGAALAALHKLERNNLK